MELFIKFIYSISITILLAHLIKRKGYLDNKGILASSIMSFIILIGTNINWLILLILFLVLGSLVSKIGKSKKNKIGVCETKRSINNVLANGLVAVLMILLNLLGIIPYNIELLGYIGAIAAGTSDTFSSELGILSKEQPVLITTFKKINPGEDGGITFWGTVFGIFGSFIIGLFASILFNNIHLIWIATISGLFGNIMDSLAGALFERKKIINNEIVNFICTLSGCILAIIVGINYI